MVACTTARVGGEMGVAGGGPGALVAAPCLNAAPWPPCARRGGASAWRRGWTEASCGLPLWRTTALKVLWRAGGGGPRAGPVSGGEPPGAGPLALPRRSPSRAHSGGQGDEAVFPPLALAHPHQHPVGITVGDVPLGPRAQTQPAGIDQPETQPGVRRLDQGAPWPDLLHTQHAGQLLALPRSNAVEDGPRSLPRQLIEARDPREMHPAGALRDFLLLQQAAEVWPPLLCTEVVGRALVVVGQRVDRGDIALVGRGGEPAPLDVLAHATSSWGHGHPPGRGMHDLLQTVATNRNIDGRSASGQSAWKAARWREPSAAYRAAVSFNA
jgi:hypothetical protein